MKGCDLQVWNSYEERNEAGSFGRDETGLEWVVWLHKNKIILPPNLKYTRELLVLGLVNNLDY